MNRTVECVACGEETSCFWRCEECGRIDPDDPTLATSGRQDRD